MPRGALASAQPRAACSDPRHAAAALSGAHARVVARASGDFFLHHFRFCAFLVRSDFSSSPFSLTTCRRADPALCLFLKWLNRLNWLKRSRLNRSKRSRRTKRSNRLKRTQTSKRSKRRIRSNRLNRSTDDLADLVDFVVSIVLLCIDDLAGLVVSSRKSGKVDFVFLNVLAFLAWSS